MSQSAVSSPSKYFTLKTIWPMTMAQMPTTNWRQPSLVPDFGLTPVEIFG